MNRCSTPATFAPEGVVEATGSLAFTPGGSRGLQSALSPITLVDVGLEDAKQRAALPELKDARTQPTPARRLGLELFARLRH